MEASEASGSITVMHHPAKPLYSLSVMSISRSNMGNFHQPVKRQGVQTLCSMMGSRKATKRRRKNGPRAKKILCIEKGGGNLFHSSCPNEKEFNWMFFIEVKKHPMEFSAFHYPIEFGTSSCKGHSPEWICLFPCQSACAQWTPARPHHLKVKPLKVFLYPI